MDTLFPYPPLVRADWCVLRAEFGNRFADRRAVDVGDHRDVITAIVPPERIDEQGGAKRRAADADMEQVADLTERPRLDRIDQHPHSLVQRLRAVDRLGRTLAALGAVFGAAPSGRIGKATRTERLAPYIGSANA